ncbi:hypothetical protein WJX82_007159 [Trebouxia sp. C0006]
MANYDTWGQSSRGLLNDFSLQSYGGEAVPLSTHARSYAPSEIEFSEIDLGSEPPVSQDAKVKLPIVSDYAAPASSKLPLRAPVDSVAAPGFSGEGESCRTVIVRTDGPVPAKYPGGSFRLFCTKLGLLDPLGLPGNSIRTAKYTVLSFLPVNLFQQFTRVANMYFLFIAFLQLIPGLSPTSWVTTVGPLCFVLFINGIKEISDDLGRHRSDAQVNNAPVTVLRGHEEGTTQWKHLQPGDLVKVAAGCQIPADLLFLSSSDSADLCYVETANLDGETNLKLKYCYRGTKIVASAVDARTFAASSWVECEKPNERLYVFEGAVVKADGSRDALDVANLLLRGCTLRNTDWVIGLVLFAGLDTKIFRNRVRAPRKVTQLEQNMNVLAGTMFLVQVIISMLCALGQNYFNTQYLQEMWYVTAPMVFPDLPPGGGAVLVQFLRFIILINQLIPISLYVTLELVKVMQCTLLTWDLHMYHKASGTPFLCRTTTLNEELGQVQYVLSDKTGTLTQNIMGFVWCSINGKLYGKQAPPEVDTPHTITQDSELLSMLKKGKGEQHQQAVDFLTHLAVCNTVVPATTAAGQLIYQAASPDEEALVQGAAMLGFKLLSRSIDQVVVEVQGKQIQLQVLAVLEFNSDRKRMSILCRLPDGRVRLYCKGADSMIYARLAPEQEVEQASQPHLAEMAREGLRTLCLGQRDITDREFQVWSSSYHEASVALQGREEAVAAQAEAIETKLTLLGATAVEDRLQEGVPQAISTLSAAGIKVWVLTGDKLETAISISLSCHLFTHDTKLMIIREHDLADGREAVSEALLIKATEANRINTEEQQQGRRPNVGLVIEGAALATALLRHNSQPFLGLCQACQGVVCCRVTPMQKAQVVSLVKRSGAITLGIGDGANDVGMIQAAHIGVGISGREGRAAVLASDYAFAQFQYLARLLLVHGRWSYLRNSEVVAYAFYKNFAYCLPNILFAAVSGFSAQPLYTSSLIATFNVVWTSWPTIGFAVLEQDVKASTVMRHPQLYRETMNIRRHDFVATLTRWLLEGLWHGIVCFFVPLLALGQSRRNGTVDGIFSYGVATYTALIIITNLKVAIRTHYFTWINVTMISLSIGCWLPALYGFSSIGPLQRTLTDMVELGPHLFSTPAFWLGVVFCAPIMALLLDFILSSWQQQRHPLGRQIFQELEQMGRVDDIPAHTEASAISQVADSHRVLEVI